MTTALMALRRFARRADDEVERCGLCAAPVPEGHRHLFDPAARRLVCACTACAILFAADGASRFRPVPERIRAVGDFALSDAEWDAMLIPIDVAFFVRSASDRRLRAFYPSPAGATESQLEVPAWPGLSIDDDVEALLVNRLRRPAEAYVVPIDACFRLVGLIRTKWRGLSGGVDVRKAIEIFFGEIRHRAEADRA